MTETTTVAIIVALIGVLGTLAGVLLGWFFALKLKDYELQRQWSKAYYDNVLEPLSNLLGQLIGLVLTIVRLRTNIAHTPSTRAIIAGESLADVEDLLTKAHGLQTVALIRSNRPAELSSLMLQFTRLAQKLVSRDTNVGSLDELTEEFLKSARLLFNELKTLATR